MPEPKRQPIPQPVLDIWASMAANRRVFYVIARQFRQQLGDPAYYAVLERHGIGHANSVRGSQAGRLLILDLWKAAHETGE